MTSAFVMVPPLLYKITGKVNVNTLPSCSSLFAVISPPRNGRFFDRSVEGLSLRSGAARSPGKKGRESPSRSSFDADPGVPDADFYHYIFLSDSYIDPSGIGKLDGVTHKVHDDLFNTAFIAGDGKGTGNFNGEDKSPVLCSAKERYSSLRSLRQQD